MYTNYAHLIERSEVRIFEKGQSVQAEPLAVVPVDGRATRSGSPTRTWFASPVRELKFVLRAYDKDGHFDETEPQPLWLKYAEGSDAGAGSADGEAPTADCSRATARPDRRRATSRSATSAP